MRRENERQDDESRTRNGYHSEDASKLIVKILQYAEGSGSLESGKSALISDVMHQRQAQA